jgi:hypothetical protein
MPEETIRVTVVLEYPVNLDLYPEGSTPAERAEIDHGNFKNDHDTLIALIEERRVVSIRTGTCTTTS